MTDVASIVDALLLDVARLGRVGDETMISLHALLGPTLEGALEVLDEDRLVQVVAPSGRALFVVQGSKEAYVCAPESGRCTCMAFTYSVVIRGESITCKHVLAARLAAALGGRHKREDVSEEQLLAHALR